MKERTSFKIEPSEDEQLIKAIKSYGVQDLARDTGISTVMMSKFIHGRTAMSKEKLVKVLRTLELAKFETGLAKFETGIQAPVNGSSRGINELLDNQE